MSRDIPMLYSAPMVRALWYGRKTQTRRLIKINPTAPVLDFVCVGTDTKTGRKLYEMKGERGKQVHLRAGKGLLTLHYSPIYAVGDRIWVKENHYRTDDGHTEYAVYAADEDAVREHLRHIDELPATFPQAVRARHRKLRPSIHMPRWASRMTLIVTDVRIERLRDISEKDAEAEGVAWETADPPFCYVPGIWPHNLTAVGVEQSSTPFSACYLKLWDHINGAGSAAANPWVVAVTFDVIKQNINEVRP